MSSTGPLRRAWRLVRTDSRTDTYVALAILVAAFGPGLVRLWKLRREARGGGSR